MFARRDVRLRYDSNKPCLQNLLMENLAESLAILKEIQDRGQTALRSDEIQRSDLDRLLQHGFLKQMTKGWYVPGNPEDSWEDNNAWHATFWGFCKEYLDHCFQDEWCLSPEQSLHLHQGNWAPPPQLLVRSPRGSNQPTELIHQGSIFALRMAMPPQEDITVIDGLRVLTLPASMKACSESHFACRSRESSAASAQITKHSREPSPYVDRIKQMWVDFRQPILDRCCWIPSTRNRDEDYLARLDNLYVYDAFHSLSIEGYHVDLDMIDTVRQVNWNPCEGGQDDKHLNALAARGYWQAFQSVKRTIVEVQNGKHAVIAAVEDYDQWYRELFGPCVSAGIIPAESLAGYRNRPAFIRNSKHVPPSAEAVRDLMPAFFELLNQEESPEVRVVLGHFFFAYIHPYADGNGRMARYLMNTMLAAGGYPWLIVPVDHRQSYLAALEAASVRQDIVPFATLLSNLLSQNVGPNCPLGAAK